MRLINSAIYCLMAKFYSALGHSGLRFILLLLCDGRMLLLLLLHFSALYVTMMAILLSENHVLKLNELLLMVKLILVFI
jgi:hypothetical protein